MFKQLNKTKLSVALSTALAAGAISGQAQAVNLTHDNLGDAAVFQYYSARDNWQTFIRLINTSGDTLAVKVRFHEGANSREILDFIVFLSPYDEWLAWTDETATELGKGNGKPGIRTQDNSCILTGSDNNTTPFGFKTIKDGNGNPTKMKAAQFSDAAFTGAYDDQGIPLDIDRLKEGYLEVISTAQVDVNDITSGYWPDNGLAIQASSFADAVKSNSLGDPSGCGLARDAYRAMADYKDRKSWYDDRHVLDPKDVLAANAYLVNITTGQGAGYDPMMLANFSYKDFVVDSVATQTKPNLDSADPYSIKIQDGKAISSLWFDPSAGPWAASAFNQERYDGFAQTMNTYQVDFWDGAQPQVAPGASAGSPGINENDLIQYDLNGDLVCNDATFPETDVPKAVFDKFSTGQQVYYLGELNGAVCLTDQVTFNRFDILGDMNVETLPGRLGQFTEAAPITGGVDAVSALIMRDSVINEWAAKKYPQDAVISQYFTQWVLTFPTKHFYVDLMDDPKNILDDFAPTLADVRDPDPITGFDPNDAFAPFSEEFDSNDGKRAGESCETFAMDIYDTEEAYAEFTSPASDYPSKMCNEVNVVVFNEDYETQGLNSKFALTVPSEAMPISLATGKTANLGWAKLNFTGTGTGEGLTAPFSMDTMVSLSDELRTLPDQNGYQYTRRYTGLPVDGFMLSIYDTGRPCDPGTTCAGASKNHTMINEHKYETSFYNPWWKW